MPKTEAPRDVGGPDEIETQQLVQGLDRRRLGNGGGSRGQLGLEGIARHRRTLEHEARVVRQQAELLEQRRHDTLRDLRRQRGRRRGRSRHPGRALERPRELLEIERIAAALLVEHRGLRAVGAGAQKLPGLPRVSAPSSTRVERACSMGALERGCEPFGHLARAHGQRQEHRCGRRQMEQCAEQLDGGRVGPMEVVEHENERLGPREQLEQLTDGSVAAVALVLDRSFPFCGEPGERREDGRQLRSDVLVEASSRCGSSPRMYSSSASTKTQNGRSRSNSDADPESTR